MKVLCDRHQLHEAFAVVAEIAPLKSPKPIIQSVLLRASRDGVMVFATDLKMSAKVVLESVKVERPGAVLLPARESLALLRELSDPTVTLDAKDFRCVIESGSGSFILLGSDPEQFPSESGLQSGKTIRMPAGRFLEMLRKTAFAAAREESRYAINGVLLECKDDCLRLVATDGRRLSLNYENLEPGAPSARGIVPLRTLQALGRAIPDGSKEPLEIVFAENQVGVQMGNTLLVSQLLESKFPDYEGVIPKMAETSVEINKSLLETNLRRVAVLCGGDVRMVRFNFTGSTLELSGENSSVGRADVVMDVDLKGAGGGIGFNPDFLLDALRACDVETVRVDMTDDSTPAKFTLGEAYTYVLMPISG